MGRVQMQVLADRLSADPGLRAEFQRDPETAVATAGIELDDADRAAIRSQDWGHVNDTELATRVSKFRAW